jgi:deoxycytidine triphosphate deaminase
MGVLTKPELFRRINNEDLIKNHSISSCLQGSSYDLCAGTIIWKDSDTKEVKTLHYDNSVPLDEQRHTTLQPGQMLLVVTKEEIGMPLDLSATVYSRNQLARDGILALNAGHVDPGYEGPIIIRLINLRAISYTLKLGNPIYTIVFQKLDAPIDISLKHSAVSRAESITKATRSVDESLANPLYDLALLSAFMKKDEFGKYFWDFIKSNIIKSIAFIIAALALIATLASGVQPLIDLVKGFFK